MATSRFARGSSNDPSKIVDRAALDDSDFVFVEKEFGAGISDDRVHEYVNVNDNDNGDDNNYDDDDDSYDYCEDVCSVLSSNDDNEHISLLSDSIDGGETETTTTTPPARLTDSILTVPSVLMKDLDEAHEAAKLTRITVGADLESADLETSCSSSNDSNDNSNDNSNSNDDDHDHETEKTGCGSSAASSFEPPKKEEDSPEDEDAGSSPTPEPPANSENMNEGGCNGCSIEDSSSLIVPEKPDALAAIPSADNRRIVVLSSGANTGNNETTPRTTPYLVFSNFLEQELLAGKKETGSGGAASGNNSTVASGSNNKAIAMSRTSNKKRRKKLKMLKKAQAAEKFQQQVALANLTLRAAAHGKSPKKTKKHQPLLQTPPRGASKKVANVAVSCVMKSMTSYREELSRQQQQSKHRPVVGLTVS